MRRVIATLAYPDSSRHLTGFNPMIYPDVVLEYKVTTRAVYIDGIWNQEDADKWLTIIQVPVEKA